MFELKQFKNEQFGLIRTMVDDIDKTVVFNGNDVANALGYANPQKALRDHCKGVNRIVTPSVGGPQKMNYIPESDLYRLVMSSKLPDAVKFQDWVCEVVLPQIRMTGGFIPVTAQDDEKTILSKALLIMQRTLDQKEKLIAANRPKVEFAEALQEAKTSITLTELAKFSCLLPMQKWQEHGLFDVHTSLIGRKDHKRQVTSLRVTAMGQEYFLKKFHAPCRVIPADPFKIFNSPSF